MSYLLATKKGVAAAIALVAVSALSSCGGARSSTSQSHIEGRRFSLQITAGPGYDGGVKFLFFKIPLHPQMACWLETTDGQYVGTISVTDRAAKKAWRGAPAAGRPEALPVWYHSLTAQPLLQSAQTDAVSTATPGGNAEIVSSLARSLPPGVYVAKLEVNRSIDYNGRFTKANSGVNGQPSLVFAAEITVGDTPSTAELVPMGTGSLDGADGSVRQGLDGLTTALTLIQKAQIRCSGR